MSDFARFLIGNPVAPLAVSLLLLGLHLALRTRAAGTIPPRRHLVVAGIAWALYAGWEYLVRTLTPEANIRVDLLVIWPGLFVISGWAIYRCFR